jgi:hypothetical protein
MGKRLADGTWQDSCLLKVKPEEPIFVLRAQDSSAPALVREWARRNRPTISDDKYNEALQCAVAMEHWPWRRNPD